MTREKIIGFVFIGVFLIAAIVGFFILPDPVVLQISTGGEAGTTLSKPFAMLVLLGLGVIGGVYPMTERGKAKPASAYLAMLIMLVVLVMVFVFNL